jgi:hypothetical protein
VCRGPHGVEDITGVDNDVHIPLQDGIDGPPVGLLDVNLPLVAVGFGIQPRVPRVPEMRIRDVRYTNYVIEVLPISRSSLF